MGSNVFDLDAALAAQRPITDPSGFKPWYTRYASQLGLSPNPDDPEHFYDWRAAYQAGATPDASGHWPSQFKREGHPNLIVGGQDTRTGQPADVFDLDAALATQQAPQRSNMDILGSSFTGLGKSGANTLIGALNQILGFRGMAPAEPPLARWPVSPEEETAYKVGNIAQFALPGGPVKGAAGIAAQGAKAGGLSLAQGETGLNAILSSILGGASVPVAAGVSKLFAPLAKSVNPAVSAAAARQGVEMPAAALSDSKLVPLAEGIAAKGIGGRGVTQRFTAAQESLTRIADDVAKRATKLQDASAVGHSIASGLDKFRTTWTKTKNALYEQAALPKKGLKLQATETVRLLDDIIETKGSAGRILQAGPTADAAFYRGLRDGLTKMVKGPDGKKVRVLKDVEARDLLHANQELTQKIKASFGDPFSAANKGALKKVSATMERELTEAIDQADPALAAALTKANEAYAEGITKINSVFGKSIHRLSKAGQYDKIAQAVANSRMSVEDIPKIMEVAGQEGADGMRAVVIADLVSKAKGPTGTLTPTKLATAIKNFGEDRLQALLTPEQYAKLSDVATLSASLQKGQKVAEGSQTAYLLSYMNVASMLAHIVGIPARQFIASKVGQRWITSGFQPFTQAGTARAFNVSGQVIRTGLED